MSIKPLENNQEPLYNPSSSTGSGGASKRRAITNDDMSSSSSSSSSHSLIATSSSLSSSSSSSSPRLTSIYSPQFPQVLRQYTQEFLLFKDMLALTIITKVSSSCRTYDMRTYRRNTTTLFTEDLFQHQADLERTRTKKNDWQYLFAQFPYLHTIELDGLHASTLRYLLPRLKSISLISLRGFTDDHLERLACTDLEQLTLEGASITDTGCTTIAQRWPHLVHLTVSNARRVTNVGCGEITQNCTQLRILNFSYCRRITNIACATIAQGCTQLWTLNLQGCETLNDEGIGVICAPIRDPKTGSYFPRALRSFDITDCILITDVACKIMSERLPSLTDLSLGYCHRITDTGIAALCGPFTDPITRAPATRSVERLNLQSCPKITNAGFTAIARGCPLLLDFNVAGCDQLTDQDLAALCSPFANPITGALIPRNFRSLNIASCTKITNRGFAAIATCPHLKSLSLSHCSQVTDTHIAALCAPTPSSTTTAPIPCGIQTLNLSYCPEITDASCVSIAQGCPHLDVVDLEGCIKVTDLGGHKVIKIARPQAHILTGINIQN